MKYQICERCLQVPAKVALYGDSREAVVEGVKFIHVVNSVEPPVIDLTRGDVRIQARPNQEWVLDAGHLMCYERGYAPDGANIVWPVAELCRHLNKRLLVTREQTMIRKIEDDGSVGPTMPLPLLNENRMECADCHQEFLFEYDPLTNRAKEVKEV